MPQLQRKTAVSRIKQKMRQIEYNASVMRDYLDEGEMEQIRDHIEDTRTELDKLEALIDQLS